MRFSWDPDKSDANLRDRGFDFAFATLIFDGPTLERRIISARRSHRRERQAYQQAIKGR
jgi:uncharacterized DUF497 family protein